MIEENILVLCPPNMTSPQNGPNGFLGDRVHQLPAVAVATQLYSQVYVWPKDPVTREMFQFLPVKFLHSEDSRTVSIEALKLGIDRTFCLYANPSNCAPDRVHDCHRLVQCHKIAMSVTPTCFSLPKALDPKGQIPLWKQLYAIVCPQVKDDLRWPTTPFFVPNANDQSWALEYVNQFSANQRLLTISPLSGAPEGVVSKQWWVALAELFSDGIIIVPVHESEVLKAKSIFGNLSNVVVIAADLAKTAALAALENMYVIGFDGGKMNLLAASKATSVLCIYGKWPASAWSMPNVIARGAGITPEEALMLVQ